jgi:hypothetical protein
MDDLQRAPGDGDRRAVTARIKKAVADGRISTADGDIRLTNVTLATTMTELGLIVRDLDQLEAVLPAGSAAPVPQTAVASQADLARSAATTSSSRTVPVMIVALVVGLLVAGGIGLVVYSSSGDSGSASSAGPQLQDPISPGATPTDTEPVDEESADPPGESNAAPFKLSEAGVQSFIATYRHKFSTTKVVDLVMYGDYAVVQVPVPGKHRHAGWLYRDGAWSDFGGVTADFPGSATIDLRQLDVAAMMRNLGKAKRTLHVEDINQSYVVLNFRPQFDTAPNVNVYVSNEYHESGYLATSLSGAVERAYPFAG